MNIIELILEIIIALSAFLGLVFHSGLLEGNYRKMFFRYYTNLSNLLVGVFYLLRVIFYFCGNTTVPWLFSDFARYAIMMTIFLTFVIYHFVLSPKIKSNHEKLQEFDPEAFHNLIVHYFVPLSTLIDWCVFADKASLTWIDSLRWAIIPLLYVIVSFILARFSGNFEGTQSPYPYFFMDPALSGGWGKVIRNVLLIALSFVFIGGIFIAVSKLIIG